ncbi:hypothetical protein PVAP13_5NG627600 [Panicum virgatum]|uniref:Uncharacterized protein n=1 Tax=Panicum virgatum TaxID=38727 RepID=A0A8T0SCJ1_PANVG|nr:hypothetical protein PVAP13_5NG627600 [Panicum virgatum]
MFPARRMASPSATSPEVSPASRPVGSPPAGVSPAEVAPPGPPPWRVGLPGAPTSDTSCSSPPVRSYPPITRHLVRAETLDQVEGGGREDRFQREEEQIEEHFGQLWAIPSPTARPRVPPTPNSRGVLVWIRKELVQSKAFGADDCYPVLRSDRFEGPPTRISFSRDLWAQKTGRSTYAEILRRRPMTEREKGRWVWQPQPPPKRYQGFPRPPPNRPAPPPLQPQQQPPQPRQDQGRGGPPQFHPNQRQGQQPPANRAPQPQPPPLQATRRQPPQRQQKVPIAAFCWDLH